MTAPQPAPYLPPYQPSGPVWTGPARAAHGGAYWALVGWWWGPSKWAGRCALWICFFPLGIWRSYAHGKKADRLRDRRGYRG